jgi:cysteinyl-tRNA synthetase
MISMIGALLKKGHAYEANGSVYYSINSFPRYGRLSGNTMEKLQAGAGGRVDDNPEKRNPLDFALWIRNPRHVMQWDSPWGKGYPGWHIECSVMSMKYLGDTVDIHTGGEDNMFPHHECEIAQSEGATGKAFVRYWLHVRHLMVDGEKMSKSKGNFYTLRDLLGKGYDPKAIRYLLLSGHYRIRLNFTEKGLKSAKETITRLQDFVSRLKGLRGGRPNPEVKRLVKKAREGFESAMDDDLNISLALGKMFDFVREINRLASDGMGREDARLVCNTIIGFDRILGLELDRIKASVGEEIRIKDSVFVIEWQGTGREAGIERMIRKREERRKEKDWKEADGIRDRLKRMGYVLEDTETGVRVKKA